jgi:hypothetical protein
MKIQSGPHFMGGFDRATHLTHLPSASIPASRPRPLIIYPLDGKGCKWIRRFSSSEIFFERHHSAERLMPGTNLFQKISVFKPLKGQAAASLVTAAQSTIAIEYS